MVHEYEYPSTRVRTRVLEYTCTYSGVVIGIDHGCAVLLVTDPRVVAQKKALGSSSSGTFYAQHNNEHKILFKYLSTSVYHEYTGTWTPSPFAFGLVGSVLQRLVASGCIWWMQVDAGDAGRLEPVGAQTSRSPLLDQLLHCGVRPP